ncbi:MAG: family 43 glycosylhydrolase [Clostridia bacterium]|nr:family 43 glycosylhydrolase [Clostridia bacterium]
MNFKKLLAMLALVLCVITLTVSVCAQESFTPGTDAVYFVDNANGKDTNAGTSANAALKTLGKANAYLREVGGGTIVISGEVAISSSFSPADVGGAVIYTSVYNGVDYRESGASLNISNNIAFNNDTYFENITLEISVSGIAISGRTNDLGFGYGVSTVDVSGLDTFNYPVIIGGWNNPGTLAGSSSANDYAVHVYSGNWYGIYGGHRRTSASNPVSDLSGDVSVVVKGGTFQNYISATGMNVHSGRVYLEISGGTFNGAIVPIRRLGTMPTDAAAITDAEFTADLLVRISGGTFNGRFRLAESTVETTALTKLPLGDATVVVTGGKYNYEDFVGYGVVGSVLLKYKPSVLANTTIKGFPVKSEITTTSAKDEETGSFANPIGTLPDPYIVEKDGLYYYCFSSGVTIDGTSYAGVKVAVHENLPFGELSAQRRTVFNASMTSIANAKHDYWAPELHYFDAATVGSANAGWYIYVAADNGTNANHRMYVLRATDPENALSDYEMVGQITDSTNKWAIDGTVLQHGGKLYFVWSGWPGNTDGCQNIYIAQMSNPWTISSERVLLSTPTYSFETQDYPDVNEGPQVLKAPDGTVHIIYSGSGSWTQYYCYGALTLTGTDPLSASSWYKSTSALFSSGNGIYGTGHGSFVKDEDGKYWMFYHANSSLTVPEGSTWWAERSTYLKPFSFTNKTVNGKSVSYPNFGTPIALETLQTISVDTADYHASGDHHYSPYYTYVSGTVTQLAQQTYLDGTVTEIVRQCYICGEYDVKSVTFGSTPDFTLSSTTDSVTVEWTKIDGADGYRIYRRDEGDDTQYERLVDLEASDITAEYNIYSYTDEKLASGTRYRYLIHAYYYDINGDYRYTATGGKEVYTKIATPTVTAEQTENKAITVTISAVNGATEYTVYRSVNSILFDELATVTDLVYVDTDITAGYDYQYKVIAKATNVESEAALSNTVRAVTVGFDVDVVTSGELYESLAARTDSTFTLYGAKAELGKTVIIPGKISEYMYSVHGEFIIPVEEISLTDDNYYELGLLYADADAIIVSETELITYGDATGDGNVSLVDIIRILNYSVNDSVTMDVAAANVDHDLDIGIDDVIISLLNILDK